MREFLSKLLIRSVAFAGRRVRSAALRKIGATIPAIAGMALISLGAAWIYLPAGLIIGGALLLRVDSQL